MLLKEYFDQVISINSGMPELGSRYVKFYSSCIEHVRKIEELLYGMNIRYERCSRDVPSIGLTSPGTSVGTSSGTSRSMSSKSSSLSSNKKNIS